MLRSASSRSTSETNRTRLSTNETPTVAQPSRCPHLSVRRPPTSRTTAPSAGSAITTQSRSKTPLALVGCTTGTASSARRTSGADRSGVTGRTSVLQEAGVVDGGRAAGAEDGHDDREPDDDLGRCHDHHEEGRDLAVEVAVDAREGDPRQVAGIGPQLHAHEDHDRVAPAEHADGADREQQGRQDDEGGGAHRALPSSSRRSSCIELVSSSTSLAGAARTVPRAASTRETEVGAGDPSGRSAGVSTALCRAKGPGGGNGPRCGPFSA